MPNLLFKLLLRLHSVVWPLPILLFTTPATSGLSTALKFPVSMAFTMKFSTLPDLTTINKSDVRLKITWA